MANRPFNLFDITTWFQAPEPQDPNAPTGGGRGDFDTRSTENERIAAHEEIARLQQQGLLPEGAFDRLNNLVTRTENGAYDIGAVWNEIRQVSDRFAADNRLAEAERQDAEARSFAMGQLDDLQAQGNTLFGTFDPNTGTFTGGERGRLEGLLTNPASIRSDAEYGALLGNIENQLATQMGQARNQAARSTANRGLRASGKTRDAISQAEMATTAQTAGALQGVFGDVQSRVNDLQERGLSFNQGISGQRSAIATGQPLQTLNFLQTGQQLLQPQTFQNTTGTGLDVRGLQVGQNNFGAGLALDFGLGLLNAGNNGLRTVTSAIPGGGN